ncbi:MAG: F0F1 ATP synthase subunit B [Planctomycetota bacterium]
MSLRVLAQVVLACFVLTLCQGSNAAAAASADGHGDQGHHDLGHGNAGASLESPAEFRTDLAVYTFAVFMLLLAILGKLAWPKIVTALEEREKRIEGSIAEAEAMNAEAKNMLAQHEAKLATAADEVRELLEEARRDAETTKAQIIADAKQAADQERERAVREVDLAADRAMHKLVETSANMAVDWAGKVAKQSITPDRQAEIVREALSNLASSSPSEN